jgi:hypothetical protein
MSRRTPLIFVVLAAALFEHSAAFASNCAGTSTGKIPLTDLGTGTYLGLQGGLYDFGSNQRPPAHDAAGMAIANAIVPLDTLGAPNPTSGRVILVSIGMSNCTQEFSAFIPKCQADPLRSPFVRPIDCAVGGQTASIIRNPAAWYWDTVATRLRARGASPLQVQVVWLKEANANPTGDFVTSSGILLDDLAGAVRTLKQKLPNVKLCYLSSRTYAGYATSTLNPEPYAYESAFAVRELIEAQMNGADSLAFDPPSGPPQAPWLAWGPYLWADGLNPRSDGLTWACADFVTSDGTHPSTSGRNKVANLLLAFFDSDSTAHPWYVRPVTTAVPIGGPESVALALSARPVPADAGVELIARVPAGVAWRIEIVDAAGRRVRSVAAGTDAPPGVLRWDLRDAAGRRAAPGVYWAWLASGDSRSVTRLVVR